MLQVYCERTPRSWLSSHFLLLHCSPSAMGNKVLDFAPDYVACQYVCTRSGFLVSNVLGYKYAVLILASIKCINEVFVFVRGVLFRALHSDCEAA